ncbi:MAG: Cell surface protein/ lipoprotein, partial [Parcubacteria group bacterium GW2011_GWE2_38_18]
MKVRTHMKISAVLVMLFGFGTFGLAGLIALASKWPLQTNLALSLGVIVVIGIILIFYSGFLSAQSSWPIFRGNQQLSGAISASLPEKPKLLSSFQTGDDIKASPVISGQTIFCGSTDGTMYAIGFDGKLKWKFDSGNAIEAPA